MDVTSIIKLLILCITLIIIVIFLCIQKYISKIDNETVGSFIINTHDVDEEIFKIEFDENPSTFISKAYIVLKVKKDI